VALGRRLLHEKNGRSDSAPVDQDLVSTRARAGISAEAKDYQVYAMQQAGAFELPKEGRPTE
jgi:hypothetical protein